ncbi:MAG TPA: geranylgeranylglyceryl/heptaprenylglyceryl phosphate synthase [Bacteroidales bacterium]|nr:geranylgeranylglyceryl/heptaprenylglyceryl phosphate synthase [Bacteroidales bacterium]
MNVYQKIVNNTSSGKKQLSILIDPDKSTAACVKKTAELANEAGVDFFFIGGSLITSDNMSKCILALKEYSGIPVVIFPGSVMQVNGHADAILFLSLISGRNAEMLIGKHVVAAPYIRGASLEVIPTGYMLIESGSPTAASYMSHSLPIPHDKDDIAMCTAMAGEMLGLKMVYLDAGSGAGTHVSTAMTEKVKNAVSVPLVVGGGVDTAEKAKELYKAGADMIVAGNAVEKNQAVIGRLADARF